MKQFRLSEEAQIKSNKDSIDLQSHKVDNSIMSGDQGKHGTDRNIQQILPK